MTWQMLANKLISSLFTRKDESSEALQFVTSSSLVFEEIHKQVPEFNVPEWNSCVEENCGEMVRGIFERAVQGLVNSYKGVTI